MPDTSVIISTYNRPAHLARCLEALRHQTTGDFEILVADDGSGPETAELVRSAAEGHPRPIRHVWQEDRGFRKCRILNKAVRAAASDYLVFTDGDCLAHRKFVECHARYRAPGRFLVGRPVKWGELRSEQIDFEAIARGHHARIGARDVWDNVKGRTRNLPYGIYLPGDWGFRMAQRLKKNRTPRGTNFSVWKSDVERVNGWNEDFQSWGLEDVEIGLRLRLAGVVPFAIVFKACTFHLHHPLLDHSSLSARKAYDASKARKLPWCPNGLLKGDAATPPREAWTAVGTTLAAGTPRPTDTAASSQE